MAQLVKCLLCKNEDLGAHTKPNIMSLYPCVKMYSDTCVENRDSMASQSKQISELQAQEQTPSQKIRWSMVEEDIQH